MSLLVEEESLTTFRNRAICGSMFTTSDSCCLLSFARRWPCYWQVPHLHSFQGHSQKSQAAMPWVMPVVFYWNCKPQEIVFFISTLPVRLQHLLGQGGW